MARDPPTSGDDRVTPTTSCPRPWMVLPVGPAASPSRDSPCVFWLLCTSTTGDEPETVTDSSSAPTFMSAFTVAVKFDGSSSASRLKVLKPCREKVTVYRPGRRSTMVYLPSPSVDTVLVFSISASLATSTVTPGSTAPDVSFTVPPIALCARARVGSATTHTSAANALRMNRHFVIDVLLRVTELLQN